MRLAPVVAIAMLAVTPVTSADTAWANGANGSPGARSRGADAIFAVGEGGEIEPVAVRVRGTFMKADPSEGTPGHGFISAANDAIAAAGGTVHVIFGGRTIATVAAPIRDGGPAIALPPALHLSQTVSALASPTLGGAAHRPRRAPTATERTAALAIAAATLRSSAAHLTVRNLTAIDLNGDGMAFAGTVDARGSGSPRTDRRLFFIAERRHGRLRAALANVQTITVSEPLLDEVAEYLVDAIDLGDGKNSVVTRQIGFDAHTYTIYSRAAAGWKAVYSGGGAAL